MAKNIDKSIIESASNRILSFENRSGILTTQSSTTGAGWDWVAEWQVPKGVNWFLLNGVYPKIKMFTSGGVELGKDAFCAVAFQRPTSRQIENLDDFEYTRFADFDIDKQSNKDYMSEVIALQLESDVIKFSEDKPIYLQVDASNAFDPTHSDSKFQLPVKELPA